MPHLAAQPELVQLMAAAVIKGKVEFSINLELVLAIVSLVLSVIALFK